MATNSAHAASVASISNWARPIRFLVGVDSTAAASTHTFETVTALMKKDDHVDIIHVTEDVVADKLPFDHRPSSIREYFTNRCTVRFPKDNWHLSFIPKEQGLSVSQTFLRTVHKHKDVDFVAVGYSTSSKTGRLGSVTDVSMRGAHIPAIINKNTAVPDHAHFVTGVDGGEIAHACVLLALRLVKPGDRVTVVHIEDLTAQPGPAAAHSHSLAKISKFDSDEVEARYTSFAKEHPALIFKRVVKLPDQGVADALLAAAEEANYLLVGVDKVAKLAAGKGAEYVGSITDRIVRDSHCTVVVVQPKHGTYDV